MINNHKILLSSYTEEELSNIISSAVLKTLENLPKVETKVTEEKLFLTSEEVMELLSISWTTLYNYKNKGILTPSKVGKRNLYRKEDIMTKLKSGSLSSYKYSNIGGKNE